MKASNTGLFVIIGSAYGRLEEETKHIMTESTHAEDQRAHIRKLLGDIIERIREIVPDSDSDLAADKEAALIKVIVGATKELVAVLDKLPEEICVEEDRYRNMSDDELFEEFERIKALYIKSEKESAKDNSGTGKSKNTAALDILRSNESAGAGDEIECADKVDTRRKPKRKNRAGCGRGSKKSA